MTFIEKPLVFANMATFPERIESFRKVVSSILPQVDKLNIYLNGYNEVPSFLKDKKIYAILSKDAVGDIKDNGKFYFMDKIPNDAYCFTIDDDINYPLDYVKKMIDAMRFYNNKVAVGIHGIIFHRKFESFNRTRITFNFGQELKRNTYTNVLGTGTLAFHKNLFQSMSIKDFGTTGMADLWFAFFCKEKMIPLICIAREKFWLKPVEAQNDKVYTLWNESFKNEQTQNDFIKRNKLWNFYLEQTNPYRFFLEKNGLLFLFNDKMNKLAAELYPKYQIIRIQKNLAFLRLRNWNNKVKFAIFQRLKLLK